jgi:4-hydroxybenzoate polyprenyltransferase
MKKYIKIARLDHWIKQFFVLPGLLFALMMAEPSGNLKDVVFRTIWGFLSTCFIASANYVINEWLDAEFDKYHPTKKYRSVVQEDVKGSIVYLEYAILSVLGMLWGYLAGTPVLFAEIWLWVMGILYNVKPFRTKDVAILDVLSESVNNAIRLLIGWFCVTQAYFPPVSIVVGYWMAGAFLMAMKRFSEYNMIDDPQLAGKYRKSFTYYTRELLLNTAFFYAMAASFLMGIFLIKYKVEFILFIPFFFGLFCYYFHIAFKEDSAAQKPEKLFREKRLMLYVLFLAVLFLVLLYVHIPALDVFVDNELVRL